MKLSEKEIIITGFTHLPLMPKAGDFITLVIQLNREVKKGDGQVQVEFKAQRMVLDHPGGDPVAKPTTPFDTYFDSEFLPKPMNVRIGQRFGLSSPIRVRKDASVPDTEVPVVFPEKLVFSSFIDNSAGEFLSTLIQLNSPDEVFQLKGTAESAGNLVLGEKVPNKAEREVVAAASTKIKRGTPAFNALTKNTNADVVFKDEEGTGADRMMTNKLSKKIDALAALVKNEWSGVKPRITEAWDENDEHGTNSVHYEARAVDLTTSDRDSNKLGRLGRLAVDAGFEWVFYENSSHIHASVSK